MPTQHVPGMGGKYYERRWISPQSGHLRAPEPLGGLVGSLNPGVTFGSLEDDVLEIGYPDAD